MKVGEIYLTRIAARSGREQAGRRPAIILQKDTNLPTVLLVPLITQQDALRFNGAVLIEPIRKIIYRKYRLPSFSN